MLDQEAPANPVDLYRSATRRAVEVAQGVAADQLRMPTPCSEWDVQALLDHLVGGSEYLLAAMDGRDPAPRSDTTAADYQKNLDAWKLNRTARDQAWDRWKKLLASI